MPVVTIRGQLGSGAPEIGRKVARTLLCDYVDREIIESIARLVGHPIDQVMEKEQAPIGIAQRITSVLGKVFERSGSVESVYSRSWQEPLDDANYLDALESVIHDLAMEENIVMLGLGSQFILHDNPSALHVLVIAPLKQRIKQVAAMSNVDEEEAQRKIEDHDNSRRAFIRRFFNSELENPDNYDLVVNTEHLSYDVSAHIIASTAQLKTLWGANIKRKSSLYS